MVNQIAAFFSVLESEVRSFANRNDQGLEEPKKRHYLLLRSKAIVLIASCRQYISILPECTSNIAAIPYRHDKNYVQCWLEEQEAGEGEDLLSRGQKLFAHKKVALYLLEGGY